MSLYSNVFNADCRKIGEGSYLHIINIESIDVGLKTFIDDNIVKVCEGSTNTDSKLVKKQLIDFFEKKKGSFLEMGAVAEFFVHLYLNELGFKQECLFLNLEERAVKKGFDGYYSFNDEEWLMESKSGNKKSTDASHPGKIKIAYDDLSDKVSGNSPNNPWKNAYNHASLIDVNCAIGIRKNIKALSDEYIERVFHQIKEFNIIPCSTIFLEGYWSSIDADDLEKKINELIIKFEFKKINIICINKQSIQLFLDYLLS